MASIADILMAQGRSAGEQRRQRANVWIPTIQQLSNLPAQVMNDRALDRKAQEEAFDRSQQRDVRGQQLESGARELAAGDQATKDEQDMTALLSEPGSMDETGTIVWPKVLATAQQKAPRLVQRLNKAKYEHDDVVAKAAMSAATLAKTKAETEKALRPETEQTDPTKDYRVGGVVVQAGVPEVKPDTRGLQVQANDALKRGDTAEYARIRRVIKDTSDDGRKPDDAAADVTALTPPGHDMAALRYKVTGIMPALGMGDKTTRQKIINRSAELTDADATRINAGGGNIAANAANFRADSGSLAAMQKQRDAITSFEKTASKNIDIFLSQAGKVVDTGSPLANSLVRNASGKLLGSPDQAAYDAARLVAINEIAKITSNPNMSGVLSDSARHEVEQFNPRSATIKQTVAVMRLLKRDMSNRTNALDETLAATRGRMNGDSATPKVTRYDENGKVIP